MTCEVEECDRKRFDLHLCRMHHDHYVETGSVDGATPKKRAKAKPRCAVKGCRMPRDLMTLCGPHNYRLQLVGAKAFKLHIGE